MTEDNNKQCRSAAGRSVAWHLQGDPSDPLSCLCIRQVPDTSFAPVTFDQRSPRNSVIDAGNVVRRRLRPREATANDADSVAPSNSISDVPSSDNQPNRARLSSAFPHPSVLLFSPSLSSVSVASHRSMPHLTCTWQGNTLPCLMPHLRRSLTAVGWWDGMYHTYARLELA